MLALGPVIIYALGTVKDVEPHVHLIVDKYVHKPAYKIVMMDVGIIVKVIAIKAVLVALVIVDMPVVLFVLEVVVKVVAKEILKVIKDLKAMRLKVTIVV